MAALTTTSSERIVTNTLNKKIIIIGAGIAGLACASHLLELGFDDITVLEAKDRVGGRMHTLHFGSHFIELGAQWIHGETQNVIYEIAYSKTLINKDALRYDDALFNANNIKEEYKDIVAKLYSCLNQLDNTTSEFDCVQTHYNEAFEQFIHCVNSQHNLIGYLQFIYENYCKLQCEINGCLCLSQVSSRCSNYYQECDGNKYVELLYGYSSILDNIQQNIPCDIILKNKQVTKVDYKDFRSDKYTGSNLGNFVAKIKVSTLDSDVFFADHVIVTIPLGCLKKKHNSLFVPMLSESKIKAINHLGFGTVNKIFLQYQDPFWKAPDNFLVLWEKSFDNVFSDSSMWMKSINRFAFTPGHPNMLCAWLAGKGSNEMESLTDSEVIKDCTLLLQLILKLPLPNPCNIYRSKWGSDIFSLGSYSYVSVDCERENAFQQNLADPEFAGRTKSKLPYPVLMFAGEATHPYFFSTVHGAYETGIREANRIFKYYRSLAALSCLCQDKCFLQNSKQILSVPDPRNYMKIAIIGAGLSGLSCAYKLFSYGFREIKILEANNVIGGRIHTIDNDKHIDLGAQWIHDVNSELYAFASEHELLSCPVDLSFEGKGYFCLSSGDVIEHIIVDEVKKVLKCAKYKLESGSYDLNNAKSVKSFFYNAFKVHIQNCKDDKTISIKKALFDWYIKFEIIDNGCDDLDNVAIESFTEWGVTPEDFYHINLKHGFSSIVNSLKSHIPDYVFCLNKKVSCIKWNENFKYKNFFKSRQNICDLFPVCICCESNGMIFADCVIVTSSIGFLKENIKTFFKPELPDIKQKALSTVGYGNICKIFLVYEQPFWSPGDLGFHLVWEDTNSSHNLLHEHPWIQGISGFDIVPNQPNVLLCWIGGPWAKSVENENTIGNVCTILLRMFLKRVDVPEPISIYSSSWYSNKHIRGAYSYRTPSFYNSATTLRDLKCPLYSTFFTKDDKKIKWPIVMFAGEALDRTAFSAAHGAFRSGLENAKLLLEIVQNI